VVLWNFGILLQVQKAWGEIFFMEKIAMLEPSEHAHIWGNINIKLPESLTLVCFDYV
jgi:hypothetical protein